MYHPGDYLEVREGVTVRLNKDTAEIANAAVKAAEWNPKIASPEETAALMAERYGGDGGADTYSG